VRDLGRIATVGQARCEGLNHAQPSIHRLEQNRAAVRAGVRAIERGDKGLVTEIGKQNTVWVP
jgi:hypothetical protein